MIFLIFRVVWQPEGTNEYNIDYNIRISFTFRFIICSVNTSAIRYWKTCNWQIIYLSLPVNLSATLPIDVLPFDSHTQNAFKIVNLFCFFQRNVKFCEPILFAKKKKIKQSFPYAIVTWQPLSRWSEFAYLLRWIHISITNQKINIETWKWPIK